MNTYRRARTYILLAVCIAVFGYTGTVSAAVTKTTLSVEPANDFVVEPAKFEVFANPGETVTKNITVTSRISQPVDFVLTTEDFKGTNDPRQPVQLLGDERGPYSLKDIIKPEISSFTLNFGERISIPVTLTIPLDAEPRGFYGAVLISTKPKDTASSSSQTVAGTRIVSRVGSLFLVRVNGNARESGELVDFKTEGPQKSFYEKAPTGFEILFRNTGSVHLVPHGLITVKNMFGKSIASLPVDAYFSLPDSVRYRQVTWTNAPFMFGRYKASLEFYKGYDNLTEVKTIVIWILPWKILLALIAALIVVIAAIYYVATRFEFRRKK